MSVGTIYGKYFLLKKLASGGMGEVFLARQQGPAGFEKVVVLKRILGHLTDDGDYLEHFLQEGRLQAHMSHSAVVHTFDLGQADDGSFYLAMEYVHGKSLDEVLARLARTGQRLPPALGAAILERAADGLAYAHALSDGAGRSLHIIHRDISPHNVLISYQGDVKLIDFGIAKSASSPVRTETGTLKGKFSYMSPEQSAAEPLDPRSDIFSLGIVLYECLTGTNPFQHPNVVMSLEAIQKLDPPAPSSIDPALAPFDAVVARALAKQRDERYADAGELRDDLARVRALLPAAPTKLGPFLVHLFKDRYAQEARVLLDTDASRLEEGSLHGAPADAAPGSRETRPEAHRVPLSPTSRSAGEAAPGEVATRPFQRRGGREVPGPPGEPAAGASSHASALATEGGSPGHPGGATGTVHPEPESQAEGERRPHHAVRWVGLAAAALVALAGVGYVAFAPRPLREAPLPSSPPSAAVPDPQPEGVQPAESERQRVDEAQRLEEARRSTEQQRMEAEAREQAEAEARGRAAADAAMRQESEREAHQEARRRAERPARRRAEEAQRHADEAGRDAQADTRLAPPASLGTLLIRATPMAELRHNGQPVRGIKVDLVGPEGTIELVGQGSPFKVHLSYVHDALVVQSEPWAIAYLDGLSKGRTPARLALNEGRMQVVLKAPGIQDTLELVVRYSKP